MTFLNLSFLGTFQAFLNNRPITTFRSAKVQGLLAFLALEAHQPHARDLLASIFWPEQSDQVARKNLRQSLYQLRQVLEDDTAAFLNITRNQVQFNTTSNYQLDVEAFLRAINDKQWEKAISYYHGDLLTGFTCDSLPFEEWLRPTRERLHFMALDALYQLTQHALDMGDYGRAETFAKRQLRLEPWREEAHQQLILALALMGERSAALAQYESCVAVLDEELGVHPADKTVQLYEAVKSGEIRSERRIRPPADSSAVPHNFTPTHAPFIGREQELQQLDQLIKAPQTRLITIVGPGGFGKTRFSFAYAERYLIDKPETADLFRDGVYFVSLVNIPPTSNLSVADNISLALLRTFKLPLDANEGRTVRSPKQQLLTYLQNKELFLLLDNFEHLLGGNMLIADIVQTAPKVKILITSRERLNLYEEQLFALRGLSLPKPETMHPTYSSIKLAPESEAVQFFLRAASRIRHDFEPKPNEWPYLCQLCYSLGGIPLALELAASWVEMLSITDILMELERSPDLLTTGLQNVATRHRSMWQILDYSWQQISEAEQQVLTALSVFRGNFTRAAAEKVITEGNNGRVPIHILASLVHKSMLYYNHGQELYTIHELLRQFAADRLSQESGREAAVRQRHSHYFCNLLAQYEVAFKSANQREALAAVETEIENIRVAWRWAIQQQNLELIAAAYNALFLFYDTRSWFQEGERVFREAAAQFTGPTVPEQRLRANLQARHGWFTFHLGNHQESLQLLHQSLETLEKVGEAAATIFNYNYIGAVLRHQENYIEANAALTKALDLAQAHNDLYQASISFNILGQTAWLQGNAALSRHYCQEALRIKREIGDTRGMTYSLMYLGRISEAQQDFADAIYLYKESMSISEAISDQRGVATALESLGGVAQKQGQYEQAAEFYRRSYEIYERIGGQLAASLALIRLGQLHILQNELEAADQMLRQGLNIALASQYEHGLLDGVLGFSQLQLKTGEWEQGLIGLRFIEQYPHGTIHQRALAHQLIKTAHPTAEANDSSPHLSSQDVATFVREWLPEL